MPIRIDILCRLLRSLGTQTASASTGEAALAAVASDRPDLVILDMMIGPAGDHVQRDARNRILRRTHCKRARTATG